MAKTWLLAGLTALAFTTGAAAQEAVPVALASTACIPSLAANACQVAGSLVLSETVTWAFYDVQAPDGRHGLSLLLVPAIEPGMLRAAASLPVSAAALDRWKRLSYAPAGVVKQGEAEYAGMAIRGEDGIEAFSLAKVEGQDLTPVDAAHIPSEVRAKALALTRPDCRIASGGMEWRFLRVRHGMMGDAGSCGTVMIDLAVDGGRVKIADALAMR